ncbi:MAG TPA: PH domain-containing protein [Mycobacteriales bacterium]|jgi:uncharacterized membrane protein YdbT with pleckstrin-like domain|nr:PH domain-containing protein [Mycobacteriales bacterium]
MGYPKRLLDDNEEIVFDLHPHWKVLLVPVLAAIATVFVASFASAKVPDGDSQALVRIIILVAAAAAVALLSVVPFVRWRTTHFVLTTNRVVMRSGLIARAGRDIPLFRVNDVTFHHSVWERMFGAGTLTVESAGERGQVELKDIPHVEAVQRELYRLVEMHENRRSGELRELSEDPTYDTDTAGYRYADGESPPRPRGEDRQRDAEPTRRLPRGPESESSPRARRRPEDDAPRR